MRTLVDPHSPSVQFHLTSYDLGVGEADINDFLHLLQHGPEDLKQKVLAYNGIVSINLQRPSPFTPNTVLSMVFNSHHSLMSYLRGERGDSNQINEIRPRLKEFFDEQDRLQAYNR